MIPRPDLLDGNSHPNLEIFQLTMETDIPSCHIYMEAQVFTPDSTRFLLHRSAHPHGNDKNDPEHCYLLCDLENDGSLMPVTDELGVTAPSVSPDGKYFYYFVDETELGGGRLLLKRRQIDGTSPETICVLDAPVPGTSFRPSDIYPLSTIRSDGRKIAISARLGDGDNPDNWGLLVFDVQTAAVELILQGPSWCNAHPQFSRSRDPQQMRDILVQENHGYIRQFDGKPPSLISGPGVDIHVIRDDGQHLRDMPWGRNGDEKCQGHQCWRGRSDWAITSTSLISANECQLIESKACAHVGHRGIATPGAIRHHLSREFPGPGFYHFATDIEGNRLITDYRNYENSRYGYYPTSIFLADFGTPGDEAPDFTFLLGLPREYAVNIQHPFLSPDGRTAFFNSDESGILQAYMMRW